MNKLCFSFFVLYAFQCANAVTPEEIKEAQRLIEEKIVTTKHVFVLPKQVFNTLITDYTKISLRLWHALKYEISAHLNRQKCIEYANNTLFELEGRVINAYREMCGFEDLELMDKFPLQYLDASLNEMKNAEETCNKREVDYHKCMQEIIKKTKDSTDEIMKMVKTFPTFFISCYSDISKCLLIDLFANEMVVRTEEATREIFECIAQETQLADKDSQEMQYF